MFDVVIVAHLHWLDLLFRVEDVLAQRSFDVFLALLLTVEWSSQFTSNILT